MALAVLTTGLYNSNTLALACFPVVRVSPLQNLIDGQDWKSHPVSDATFVCQQLCQRRTAGKTALTLR